MDHCARDGRRDKVDEAAYREGGGDSDLRGACPASDNQGVDEPSTIILFSALIPFNAFSKGVPICSRGYLVIGL